MPGYEPFLLCDFHVHTRWSDGNLTIREAVDVYGQAGRFDVIAITDHILMEKDRLARFGRPVPLGYHQCSVTEDRFAAYLAEIEAEAERARRLYDLLVVPGAEITQTHLRSSKNSHIIGLNVRRFISADQPAEDILKEIRKQGAFSIACHPHHRATRRVEMSTGYRWDYRKRLVELADVWEAANRDDLFSVTSLDLDRDVAHGDVHELKHLYSWKTLVRCAKNWEAIARTLREKVDVALTLYRNESQAA